MHPRIFIIEDEPIMAECLERAARRAMKTTSLSRDRNSVVSDNNPAEAATGPEILAFSNAISAMAALNDGLPDLILLDILLDGPDGFTFLNELISYPDTARIPIIIVSSLDLSVRDLAAYGVVATLRKDTMTPAEITATVRRALAPTVRLPAGVSRHA